MESELDRAAIDLQNEVEETIQEALRDRDDGPNDVVRHAEIQHRLLSMIIVRLDRLLELSDDSEASSWPTARRR